MRLHKLNQVLENEPTSDVVRTSSYRPELFGRHFINGVQEVLRESSEWTVGECELFAAFVSRKNSCQY